MSKEIKVLWRDDVEGIEKW